MPRKEIEVLERNWWLGPFNSTTVNTWFAEWKQSFLAPKPLESNYKLIIDYTASGLWNILLAWKLDSFTDEIVGPTIKGYVLSLHRSSNLLIFLQEVPVCCEFFCVAKKHDFVRTFLGIIYYSHHQQSVFPKFSSQKSFYVLDSRKYPCWEADVCSRQAAIIFELHNLNWPIAGRRVIQVVKSTHWNPWHLRSALLPEDLQ